VETSRTPGHRPTPGPSALLLSYSRAVSTRTPQQSRTQHKVTAYLFIYYYQIIGQFVGRGIQKSEPKKDTQTHALLIL